MVMRGGEVQFSLSEVDGATSLESVEGGFLCGGVLSITPGGRVLLVRLCLYVLVRRSSLVVDAWSYGGVLRLTPALSKPFGCPVQTVVDPLESSSHLTEPIPPKLFGCEGQAAVASCEGG